MGKLCTLVVAVLLAMAAWDVGAALVNPSPGTQGAPSGPAPSLSGGGCSDAFGINC
jgi:hypothetical protein